MEKYGGKENEEYVRDIQHTPNGSSKRGEENEVMTIIISRDWKAPVTRLWGYVSQRKAVVWSHKA